MVGSTSEPLPADPAHSAGRVSVTGGSNLTKNFMSYTNLACWKQEPRFRQVLTVGYPTCSFCCSVVKVVKLHCLYAVHIWLPKIGTLAGDFEGGEPSHAYTLRSLNSYLYSTLDDAIRPGDHERVNSPGLAVVVLVGGQAGAAGYWFQSRAAAQIWATGMKKAPLRRGAGI